MMNNFDKMVGMINDYLLQNEAYRDILSDLKNASKPDGSVDYVYKGKHNFVVIKMDEISKGYKEIKKPENKEEKPVNAVDAFLINHKNEWYFIEFKDSSIQDKQNSLKNNLLKKAYSNWYMLMDMLYEMKDKEKKYIGFDFNDPVKFAQNNVFYIVVCTLSKNPRLYELIKGEELSNRKHTPEFMSRLKGYLFKDAYVYTEDFFERKFASKFVF